MDSCWLYQMACIFPSVGCGLIISLKGFTLIKCCCYGFCHLCYHVSKLSCVCFFSACNSGHVRVSWQVENSGSSRSGGGLGPCQDQRAAGRWWWDTNSQPKPRTILLLEGFYSEKLLEEVSSVTMSLFLFSLTAVLWPCAFQMYFWS